MRPTKTVWKNDNWQKRNYGGQSWCAQDCPAQDRPLPSMGDPEVGNPDFHSFNCIWHLLQVANTEQDVFFLFLTWLNFGSSLNTLPRVIIRTGFVQFLSPIDFCFLLQLSLTHSNYNLGNWQELMMDNWYGCILSNHKTAEPLRSSSITIAAASVSTSLEITTIAAARCSNIGKIAVFKKVNSAFCKNIGMLRFLLSLLFYSSSNISKLLIALQFRYQRWIAQNFCSFAQLHNFKIVQQRNFFVQTPFISVKFNNAYCRLWRTITEKKKLLAGFLHRDTRFECTAWHQSIVWKMQF